MNRSKNFTLAITALALATGASAWEYNETFTNLTQTLYGIGRNVVSDPMNFIQRHGFEDLEPVDFPAFGSFSWDQGGNRVSSSFGMAYRTHRHFLAKEHVEKLRKGIEDEERYQVRSKRPADEIDATTPLGRYDESTGMGTRLIGAIKVDQLSKPAYQSQAQNLTDLWAHVSARLEGQNFRSLVMALRSKDGTRIRPIFIYSAQGTYEHWVCNFYDPQIQVASSNGKRSDVSGMPEKPGRGRFHQLRFQTNGFGAIEVSGSWLDEVEKGEAFADGDGEWRTIDWRNIYTVDFNGTDYYEYVDVIDTESTATPLPPSPYAVLHGLATGTENSGVGGHGGDLERDNFEFGADDLSSHNPGAPGAPETD
jgi:hypothetical protein